MDVLGETGLAARTLPPSARRSVAALWFAAFAALATFLFFLRLVMAPHAVILYVVLPSLAAGIAGYIWGGAILDPSRVQNYGQAVLARLFNRRGNVRDICRALRLWPSHVGRAMVFGTCGKSLSLYSHAWNSYGRTAGCHHRHDRRAHSIQIWPPPLCREWRPNFEASIV